VSGKTALEMSPTEWRHYRPFHGREKSLAVPPDEARRVAAEIAQDLRQRFKAKKIVLFGSLARGEFSGRSDIDLAVWGISSGEFYRAVALASGYSKIWAVDLVDGADCSESLRLNIEREGVEL
jgi:predicted nucleotidyltransferase